MIRPAQRSDLPAVLRVYDAARAYMAASGNPHQWGDDGYPERALLEDDIQKRQLFVVDENGVHGAFVFLLGEDPTYRVIEDGHWLNDKPYGTLHRVASDGEMRGVFTRMFEFALSRADEIRIDTHHDNKTMQHVVGKHGFVRCGIIYLENGDPRIAYHFSKEAQA